MRGSCFGDHHSKDPALVFHARTRSQEGWLQPVRTLRRVNAVSVCEIQQCCDALVERTTERSHATNHRKRFTGGKNCDPRSMRAERRAENWYYRMLEMHDDAVDLSHLLAIR
jgi:hypothetical protein